jgi:hypothetical protein
MMLTRRQTHFRFRAGHTVVLLLCLCVSAQAMNWPASWSHSPSSDFQAIRDLGPVYARDLTLETALRERALGPLWERQSLTNAMSFNALRPFWSQTEDLEHGRVLTEMLWPLGMVRDRDGDRFWRFLIAYGHDFDTTAKSRFRTVIFPLFMTGRTQAGERYTGLFPFWGDVREVLTYDRIRFALFPLYAEMWRKDLHSVNWLWPFFSRTESDTLKATRFFPFYGHATHQDKGSAQFVMWPICTHYATTPGGEGARGFVLWPLFGNIKHKNGFSRWVLPPFFKYARMGGETEIQAPWPFVRYRDGKKKQLYLWPIWGHKSVGPVESSFFMWPIVRNQDVTRRDTIFRRRYVLPFWYYLDEKALATSEHLSRYLKLWPLFSYQREGQTARLRLLELWPLKHTGSIERNLAPLWTLYTNTRKGDAKESELLWGLYRHRRSAEGDRYQSVFPLFNRNKVSNGDGGWSILRGLVGMRHKGLKKEMRLLYLFKIGDVDVGDALPADSGD